MSHIHVKCYSYSSSSSGLFVIFLLHCSITIRFAGSISSNYFVTIDLQKNVLLYPRCTFAHGLRVCQACTSPVPVLEKTIPYNPVLFLSRLAFLHHVLHMQEDRPFSKSHKLDFRWCNNCYQPADKIAMLQGDAHHGLCVIRHSKTQAL